MTKHCLSDQHFAGSRSISLPESSYYYVYYYYYHYYYYYCSLLRLLLQLLLLLLLLPLLLCSIVDRCVQLCIRVLFYSTNIKRLQYNENVAMAAVKANERRRCFNDNELCSLIPRHGIRLQRKLVPRFELLFLNYYLYNYLNYYICKVVSMTHFRGILYFSLQAVP